MDKKEENEVTEKEKEFVDKIVQTAIDIAEIKAELNSIEENEDETEE